jgi:hypothetical protein
MAAARIAWISGIVIAILSIAEIASFAEWEGWVTAVAGVWLIVAPWVGGFSLVSHAIASFVVLGVVVVLASLSEVWTVHRTVTPLR